MRANVFITDGHWRKSLVATRALGRRGIHVTVGETTRLAFVNPDCLNTAYVNPDYLRVLQQADLDARLPRPSLAFVADVLQRLEDDGIDLDVYYVASAELFDLKSRDEQERIFPEERAREAMGVTGFTLPTMYRWIRSDLGRAHTLHPYRKGHYLGSGQGPMVLAEAGLDGESQARAIKEYVEALA